MLRANGLEIVERPLADHADFATLPWPIGAADVVVTEKDAVKLPPTRPIGSRVWVARLDFVPGPGIRRCAARAAAAPSVIERSPWKHGCLSCSSARSARDRCSIGGRRSTIRQELVCNADGLAFPVRDGIPVMLESEARALGRETAPTPLPETPT